MTGSFLAAKATSIDVDVIEMLLDMYAELAAGLSWRLPLTRRGSVGRRP